MFGIGGCFLTVRRALLGTRYMYILSILIKIYNIIWYNIENVELTNNLFYIIILINKAFMLYNVKFQKVHYGKKDYKFANICRYDGWISRGFACGDGRSNDIW